jgi:arylsulfatase A-like enzyme
MRTQRGLLVLLAALPLLVGACAPDREKGPNILLVTVDTLRADHVGVYGFEANTTPNLDALARRGVLFERAIAASSYTAPSHATMLTSLFVREHSVGHSNGATRLGAEPTLAMAFHDTGYDTAAFVSNVVLKRRIGLDRGFDVYDDETPQPELNRSFIFERKAEQTTESAIAWLEDRGERPWFLWVHYQDPHGPYTPPPPHDSEFRLRAPPDEQPLPMNTDDVTNGKRGIPPYQVIRGLDRLTQYRNRYAGEIRYFDRVFGKLLIASEAAAAASGLVVLVTSDHGESLGEEEYYLVHGHATTPDLSRVPMVLVAPGLASERRRDLVHHVDVMPTLLGLAGLPVPEEARGLPLGKHLREGTPIPDRFLFCEIGVEVSAYWRDGLIRTQGLEPKGSGENGDARSFAWSTDGTWTRTVDDPMLLERMLAGMKPRAPMILAEGWEEKDIARLKELGYVIEGDLIRPVDPD